MANTDLGKRQRMLRQAVSELVGATFYGPLMKMARNNPFKGKIGHGGRGEEMFGAQLDMELARRASLKERGGLAETIYRRYAKEL